MKQDKSLVDGENSGERFAQTLVPTGWDAYAVGADGARTLVAHTDDPGKAGLEELRKKVAGTPAQHRIQERFGEGYYMRRVELRGRTPAGKPTTQEWNVLERPGDGVCLTSLDGETLLAFPLYEGPGRFAVIYQHEGRSP